jgi:hypothetical protein
MSINKTISNSAEEFAKNHEIIVAKLVDELVGLSTALPKNELLKVVSTIDIETFMNEDLGFANEIEKLMLGYKSVLLDTPFFASISEDSLEALASLDEATYFAHSTMVSNKVRLEVMKGVIAGKSNSMISKTMRGILRPDQANVLAHTSMQNFSRAVVKSQMDNAPKETKYVYQGALKDTSRDICVDMVSAGELTMDEIIDTYGEGVLLDGGGFNCVHRWTPVTSSSETLTDKAKADNYKQEREGKGKYNPISLEEIYENKA